MWNDISEESMRKLERIAENEMLTQEEIRENLDVTEKGKIRQSIQNCKYALEHDPYLQGAICRNDLPDRYYEKGSMETSGRPDDGYGYEQSVPLSGKELWTDQ